MSDSDQDPVWCRTEPDSPCVKICAIHPVAEICIGCLRSADEIENWAQMSADQRQAILQALPDRHSKLSVRRGGRRKP